MNISCPVPWFVVMFVVSCHWESISTPPIHPPPHTSHQTITILYQGWIKYVCFSKIKWEYFWTCFSQNDGLNTSFVQLYVGSWYRGLKKTEVNCCVKLVILWSGMVQLQLCCECIIVHSTTTGGEGPKFSLDVTTPDLTMGRQVAGRGPTIIWLTSLLNPEVHGHEWYSSVWRQNYGDYCPGWRYHLQLSPGVPWLAGQELTGITAALQPAYKVKYGGVGWDYIQCFVNILSLSSNM